MSLRGLIGALGHAIVSWGLGGPGDESPPQQITVSLPTDAEPYTNITIQGPVARTHIGDTAVIEPIVFRDRDGALIDPDAITAIVKPRDADQFELVYGEALTTGDEDAFIRRSLGTFAVQIAITPERGDGIYDVTIVSNGSRGAEPMTFKVQHREV